jgi:hypothetical protein
MAMKRWGFLVVMVLALPGPLAAERLDLGVPRLAPSLPPEMLRQPEQAVATGEAACDPTREVCVAPQFGIEYRQREDADAVKARTQHDFSARAGWRLSLFDAVELSTAAKLTLLSAEESQAVMTGDYRTGSTTRLRAGDQSRLRANGVAWGSDLLFKINNRFNLNLFYDYNKAPTGLSGQSVPDERFGTRIEYKFK